MISRHDKGREFPMVHDHYAIISDSLTFAVDKLHWCNA
jgi:hypothetical protein